MGEGVADQVTEHPHRPSDLLSSHTALTHSRRLAHHRVKDLIKERISEGVVTSPRREVQERLDKDPPKGAPTVGVAAREVIIEALITDI
jgi:hypothetical protein